MRKQLLMTLLSNSLGFPLQKPESKASASAVNPPTNGQKINLQGFASDVCCMKQSHMKTLLIHIKRSTIPT